MAITEERITKIETDISDMNNSLDEIKKLIIGINDARSYKTTLSASHKVILDKFRSDLKL